MIGAGVIGARPLAQPETDIVDPDNRAWPEVTPASRVFSVVTHVVAAASEAVSVVASGQSQVSVVAASPLVTIVIEEGR